MNCLGHMGSESNCQHDKNCSNSHMTLFYSTTKCIFSFKTLNYKSCHCSFCIITLCTISYSLIFINLSKKLYSVMQTKKTKQTEVSVHSLCLVFCNIIRSHTVVMIFIFRNVFDNQKIRSGQDVEGCCEICTTEFLQLQIHRLLQHSY